MDGTRETIHPLHAASAVECTGDSGDSAPVKLKFMITPEIAIAANLGFNMKTRENAFEVTKEVLEGENRFAYVNREPFKAKYSVVYEDATTGSGSELGLTMDDYLKLTECIGKQNATTKA